MTLDTELDEYDSKTAEAVGFKVLVHEKNELPLVEGNGFSIMPGVTTFVAIKKHKVRMGGCAGTQGVLKKDCLCKFKLAR